MWLSCFTHFLVTQAYDSIRSEVIKLKYYKNINRLENKV